MSTPDASWVLMMPHEYHDASRVLMMHHEYSWCIMSTHDAPWILMMHHEYSWCIRFVTKWDAMEVERISTRPISMKFRRASLQISRFAGSHFWFFWICFIFNTILGGSRSTQGASRDHQASVWRQLGSPGTILEVFCDEVTFQEIHKSWKINFLVFPVTVFEEVGRIDSQSTPDLPPQ